MSIEAIVNEFSAVAANPKGQLKAYKDAGKKCIGVMPYYAPEELVYAAGMMPFGMWGSNNKTEQRSKEYCATFYCTIAQLDLEMLLDGTMDLLDGVITPTICDTLRPMSQNIRVAMSEKLPCIFLAHPLNRFADWGKQFCLDQYNNVAIAADDVAHESRAFRTDASEEGDPMMALVDQFTNIDYDVLLYDPQSNQNRRGEFVANMVKESGAQGLVLFMQQFCDPEEMEFPYLKKALDAAGIPFIKLGIDQQMRDFGQAATAIQAFADVLSVQ